MTESGRRFSFVLLGEQSLLIQCADLLRARGHAIRCVVTEDRRIAQWAAGSQLPCLPRYEGLQQAVPGGAFDYLLSITNLRMLPEWLLQLPRLGAVNFHDGPLPRYAGLNVPVWALVNGETEHGVTWHEIMAGADRGRILAARTFPLRNDETVFSLNAQCYQAGLESFTELVDLLERGQLQPREQDFSRRSYFGLADRPARAAGLDWSRPASELARLVRALDFARYPNPVALPKLDLGHGLVLVREAHVVDADNTFQPGQIQTSDPDSITVRSASDALKLTRFSRASGEDLDAAAVLREYGLQIGSMLPAATTDAELEACLATLARHEGWWLRQLRDLSLSDLPFAKRATQGAAEWLPLAASASDSVARSVASLLLLVGRLNGQQHASVAFTPRAQLMLPAATRRYVASGAVISERFDPAESFRAWMARMGAQLERLETRLGWLSDLPARDPDRRAALQAVAAAPLRLIRCEALPASAAAAAELPLAGAALALFVDDAGRSAAWIDGSRFDRAAFDRFAACWKALQHRLEDAEALCGAVSVLSQQDAAQLALWSAPLNAPLHPGRLHELFEAQVLRTPAARAVVFEGRALSYGELNAAANRLARHLQSLGVKRGDLVGVQVPRSLEMIVALQAVHKAGAAYVPLDPTYPEDRLAYMAEDAKLHVVITRSDVAARLPVQNRVELDRISADLARLDDSNLGIAGDAADLAYVIYTSGSTGKPKGVMVEHRNVVNFFAGMDERIGPHPGTWLAVTSISFDISVLELFWTLSRGFAVVLHGDALRLKGKGATTPALPSGSGARKPLDFGLFYWNVAKSEADYDAEKYRLLIESAKFADSNGFNAVWTPERHFEAFGGLFPNPSVTSAALAMITKNVKLRAGSCVVPLHSPIRIAEEWAIVDNLSNGRVGMSVAAGWAPPDFAIKPENFANAKQVMFESTEIVKRLWRGETVNFPGPKGEVKVRTLPRPVQKELPIWVTTAGNIDTYISAAKAGANVLTHLLGQSIEEVTEKVAAYRKAWTEAGHPGRGIVTVMLHTLVGPDAEAVERIVRQPLKDYLRSAVFLVKAAAWQFPTFKKMSDEQGKTLDEFFASISEQDMDDLLEFAFLRYFRTSGLFGTPEHCLEMVGRVENADVDEIACLIDYGISTETVLEHLPWLDQLRALAQRGEVSQGDHSLAGLLWGEQVTHFQCTPTMATMLAADADSQPGLASLQHMMVGGEALPPDLARSLAALVKGKVSNMYGPTETTIWSTVGVANDLAITPSSSVAIGTPLLNQSVHIVDDLLQPLPPGLPGEIVIGGLGVTRGYWQRPELTAERFPGGTLYRTGDLGRFLADGSIECLGRRDQQVKIRGYRVELGEIEALLREQPGVAEAAVVLREDSPGDQRLVGYVRTADGREADAGALRAGLGRNLPDFMVPSLVVTLESMPTTPNGKIDRKALPAPQSRTAAAAPLAAAGPPVSSTGAEALVMEIWQRALGTTQIGLRDNFFDIGGHSLLVIQVLKDLREKVSKPIQMTDLFRHTTIEALARFIEGDVQAGAAAQRGKSRADARRAAMGRK